MVLYDAPFVQFGLRIGCQHQLDGPMRPESSIMLLHKFLELVLKVGEVVDGLDNLAFTRTKATPGESHSPRAFIPNQGIVVCRFPALLCRALREVFAQFASPGWQFSRSEAIEQIG